VPSKGDKPGNAESKHKEDRIAGKRNFKKSDKGYGAPVAAMLLMLVITCIVWKIETSCGKHTRINEPLFTEIWNW
jgi:hypothetical protein